MEYKRCAKCGVEKPTSEFQKKSVRGKPGLAARCKTCRSVDGKSYYETNRDRHAAYMKAYYQANGERLRQYRRDYGRTHDAEIKAKRRERQHISTRVTRTWFWAKKYGLGPEEAQAFLDRQGGGCAICGKTSDANGKHLAVDHDHVTGRVRGFLCMNCNNGLGRFGDDVGRLQKAIEYVSANIRAQS